MHERAHRIAQRHDARGHAVAPAVAPPRAVALGGAARAHRRARHGRPADRRQPAVRAAGWRVHRGRAATAFRAAVRRVVRRRAGGGVPGGRGVHGERPRAAAPRATGGARRGRHQAAAQAQAVRRGLRVSRRRTAGRGGARCGDQHARQGDPARVGLAGPHPRRRGRDRRADRGAGPGGVPDPQQSRLHPHGVARRHLPGLSQSDPGSPGRAARRAGRDARPRRGGDAPPGAAAGARPAQRVERPGARFSPVDGLDRPARGRTAQAAAGRRRRGGAGLRGRAHPLGRRVPGHRWRACPGR